MSKEQSVGIFLVGDDMIDKGLAGASVSWELVDEIDHAELVSQLTLAEIGHTPEKPTPASALARTISKLYKDRSCLVKAVPNPTGSKSPAYGVLPRKDEDGRMTFKETWSVGLDTAEDGMVVLAWSDSAPDQARDDVEVLFPAAMLNMGRVEQSLWLTSLVKHHLRGVPTIGGAGTYFIAPAEVHVWRKLREVLRPYGVRLYEIPAMKSTQALECVVESVRRYTQTAIDELNADLAQYQEQKRQEAVDAAAGKKVRAIQRRVLDGRQARIAEQLAVVEKYESLFDSKMDELRSSLSELQAGFTLLDLGGSASPL